jgi:hypothetical protein
MNSEAVAGTGARYPQKAHYREIAGNISIKIVEMLGFVPQPNLRRLEIYLSALSISPLTRLGINSQSNSKSLLK